MVVAFVKTSSTLYNAADRAGLKMVERTTHSKTVGYVHREEMLQLHIHT